MFAKKGCGALYLGGGCGKSVGPSRIAMGACLWVIHFNDEGPEGLIDRKSTGRPPKLTPAQQEAVMGVLQEGPDPEVDGVVRWRCKDIAKMIKDQFGIDLDERNVGRLFRRQGFSYISARPRHPKQKPERIEEFKKNSPTIWQKSYPVYPVTQP